MNEEIKNRVLMEMNEVLNNSEMQKLKSCLERNFYGMTIIQNSTEKYYFSFMERDIRYMYNRCS